MGEPSRFKPMTLALVGLGVLAAATALLPQSFRPWNFSAIGALALFASARLGFFRGLIAVAAALVVKDVGVYYIYHFEPYPLSWVYFTMYAVIGYCFLRKTESPLRIGAFTLSASFLFFVISNFVSWLEQALPYGYSLEGFIACYEAGIPFYRATLIGDLTFSGAFFGLHYALSHAYFPAERVVLSEQVRESEEHW
jgi:hypothetical protein